MVNSGKQSAESRESVESVLEKERKATVGLTINQSTNSDCNCGLKAFIYYQQFTLFVSSSFLSLPLMLRLYPGNDSR